MRNGGLAAALVGALAACFVIVGLVYIDSRNKIDRTQQALDRAEEAIRQNMTSLQAHCIERTALDRQIARSFAFLKANPRGPIFGIPRNLLVVNLDQLRQERHALRILDCKEAP